MKWVLFAALFLVCCSVTTTSQSCLTPDDVKQLLARVDSSPPPAPNKKLKEDLLKMATKQRDALVQMVEKDKAKESDRNKLHKLYQEHTLKFCELLKTNGWP